MRRRTLDFMFSTGGILLAGLLLVLGLVLADRASFADDYVSNELGQQAFEFKAVDQLDPREIEYTEARTGCVVDYAGQAVTTGKQAECYANEYLGGHLTWLATRLGMDQVAYVDGMNYVELGAEQGRLRTEIAAAEEANDPGFADLEQQLADVTTVRTKMFEGTMLRNALLTSYGFGEFGTTADKAATVSFFVAALLFLLSIAGYVHAVKTPKDKGFAVVEPTNGQAAKKELAGV